MAQKVLEKDQVHHKLIVSAQVPAETRMKAFMSLAKEIEVTELPVLIKTTVQGIIPYLF